MDRFVIKNIIITSLIIGLILGIIAPIPIAGIFALISIMLFASPLVILYLIMDGKLEITSKELRYGAYKKKIKGFL